MKKNITWRRATEEELLLGSDEMIKVYEEEIPDFQAESLEEAKEIQKELIDKKTQELIFQGFIYNNLTWSLSLNAQINWSNLPQLPQAVFPLMIQDMNGVDYPLSYLERMNFYYKAVQTKNYHLQSGNLLKTQISELTTIEEIINFKDNR